MNQNQQWCKKKIINEAEIILTQTNVSWQSRHFISFIQLHSPVNIPDLTRLYYILIYIILTIKMKESKQAIAAAQLVPPNKSRGRPKLKLTGEALEVHRKAL